MFRYQPTRGKDGIVVDQLLTAGHKLANGDIQDIHEESATQNYTIGTRLVMDDRVFRYCYAKGDLNAFKGGASDVMPREGAGDAVAYEVGEDEVTIPMNQYGDDYTIEKGVNYWAEGYYWSGVSTPTVGQMHRIKSSAVATTVGRITSLTGGYVTATLYEPLKYRIPASTWQTSWVNPFKTVKAKSSGRQSIICQPLRNITATYYFWGQTWGPCFGQLNNTAIGRNDGDREIYYASDGSLMSSMDVVFTAGSPHNQRAGFVITCTRAWTNQDNGAELGGDQFYMLQLSP